MNRKNYSSLIRSGILLFEFGFAIVFLACFARDDMALAFAGLAFGLVPLLMVCVILHIISRVGGKPILGVNFKQLVRGACNSWNYHCTGVNPKNMINPPSAGKSDKS